MQQLHQSPRLLPQPACGPDQTLPAGFRRPPQPFLTCFLSLPPSAEGTVVAYIFSRNSRVLFAKRQNKSVDMSDLCRSCRRAPHSCTGPDVRRSHGRTKASETFALWLHDTLLCSAFYKVCIIAASLKVRETRPFPADLNFKTDQIRVEMIFKGLS